MSFWCNSQSKPAKLPTIHNSSASFKRSLLLLCNETLDLLDVDDMEPREQFSPQVQSSEDSPMPVCFVPFFILLV